MEEKIILPRSFYLNPDVVTVARSVLGKVLVTCFDGVITSGIISETEAYAGITDRASHAYGNRLTCRTEVMYQTGGKAYIYLCYGLHSLFNLVTNEVGIPHAVLIRGIIPLEGKEQMSGRAGKRVLLEKDGSGPGRVTKLLGINYRHTGLDMVQDQDKSGLKIWLEDRGIKIQDRNIRISKRVGVDYAGEDALLPYRFSIMRTPD
jgi:DNA-3-methyladenine glycosylase